MRHEADGNGHGDIRSVWHARDALIVSIWVVALILFMRGALLFFDAGKFFILSSYKSIVILALSLLQYGAFLLPFYFFIWKKYRLSLEQHLAFRWIGVQRTLWWILKAYGVVILINILFALITGYFGIKSVPGFDRQDIIFPLFGESKLDIGIAIFVVVFIAPVIEELIFRSFILQTFLMRFGPIFASIFTAAIFAAVHFEFQSIAAIFVLALILNWIFLRTRSVIPCIGFHMINNSVAFLVEFLVSKGYLQL